MFDTATTHSVLASQLDTLETEIADAYQQIADAEGPGEHAAAQRALDEVRNPGDVSVSQVVTIPVALGGPHLVLSVHMRHDATVRQIVWSGSVGTDTECGVIADGSAIWCWARDLAETAVAPF